MRKLIILFTAIVAVAIVMSVGARAAPSTTSIPQSLMDQSSATVDIRVNPAGMRMVLDPVENAEEELMSVNMANEAGVTTAMMTGNFCEQMLRNNAASVNVENAMARALVLSGGIFGYEVAYVSTMRRPNFLGSWNAETAEMAMILGRLSSGYEATENGCVLVANRSRREADPNLEVNVVIKKCDLSGVYFYAHDDPYLAMTTVNDRTLMTGLTRYAWTAPIFLDSRAKAEESVDQIEGAIGATMINWTWTENQC